MIAPETASDLRGRHVLAGVQRANRDRADRRAQVDANSGADESLRQTDFGDVRNLAQKRIVTSPEGTPFTAACFIVHCPIISIE
ncbi:MAG: hypothetical protein H6945_09470 [Zoogloeaceae bacterium]|nr:hypothetical protein [Rhodocyclaceae bacterium]MCP5235951.1 hypothetical protein [Zoogloeaceae bacterium]